jgi:DnaJ family protein C protein 8
MEQAYKTLLDADKRKVFQRVYREAKERVTLDREKENRRRMLKGLAPLPEDTFDIQINIEMKNIKEEIEERNAYAEKQEFAHKKRERDEEEERKMQEEYEKQQKKEWESYRDKRVKNWNKFQHKNTGGKKKGKYELRPPQHKLIEKPQIYNIDIYRPNI